MFLSITVGTGIIGELTINRFLVWNLEDSLHFIGGYFEIKFLIPKFVAILANELVNVKISQDWLTISFKICYIEETVGLSKTALSSVYL